MDRNTVAPRNAVAPRNTLERLRRALPDIEISGTWDVVRRRSHAWAWPAVQMGVLDDSAPDRDDIDSASNAVERLMSAEVEHAVLVALKEEVRGLLADLDDIVEMMFDDAPAAPDGLRSAAIGDIVYGDR